MLFTGGAALAQTAVTGHATAASATVAEAADAGASGGQVDELVVTARRRTEDAQTVPIALTVVGGSRLEATGTYNIAQITQLAPSITFTSFNPRNTNVNIRGLGNNLGLASDGLEPGVGLYIDQVYFARPAAATFDLTDIERIEILRGPQGTLFGKNTTAGALNVTTRAPSFTPEGSVEVTAGNYGFWQGKASVSGPIIGDKLAGRVSISGTRRDGLTDNVLTGEKVNNQDNVAVRGQLLYQPTQNFTLRLSGDYSRQQLHCCLLSYAGYGPSQKPAAAQFPALAAGLNYTPASLNAFDRLTDSNANAHANQSIGGVSAVAEWDLGPATLTSVTAWRSWSWDPANDADFTRLSILNRSENADEQRQFSQELRIASNGTNTVDWLAGLYYFRQTIDAEGVTEYGANSTYWLLSPLLPAALTDGYRNDFVATSSTKSYAVFGQITWHATDKLAITPGLRYTYEEKTGDYASTVSGGLATTNPTLLAYKRALSSAQAYSTDIDDGKLSGQINVAYQATPDLLIYGNYAKGYKSGGLNLAGVPNDSTGAPDLTRAVVAPEETDAFELGLKSRWFDNRVTANLAVFRTDTSNYQANVVDTVGGSLKQYISNIAKVRSQGVELDLSLARTAGFTGYGSVSYTDASYVSYANGPCPLELIGAATTVCDLSGRPLPGVSRWSVSLGGEYAHAITLGSVEAEGYVGVDYSYRSGFFSAATDSIYSRIDAYSLANLRVGARFKGGDLDLSLWAKNLFDEEYYQYISAQAGNSGALYASTGDPRTYGVTLRAKF